MTDHFLSTCRYLPPEDQQFMSRARQSTAIEETTFESDSNDYDNCLDEQQSISTDTLPTTRRVSTKQSPVMKAYYNQHVVHITLDSGAEISMIRASIADHIGVKVQHTKQHALQADGCTPLETLGETHFDVVRDNITLHIEALVVKDLDVDILAGIPFMSANDISIRPAKHIIMVGDNHVIKYNHSQCSLVNHIRRAQAHILRAPSVTIWPGDHIDIALPEHIPSEGTVALEPRIERTNLSCIWPKPEIVDVIAGKVRVVNNTDDPKLLKKNEQFCQVLPTVLCDNTNSSDHHKNTHSPQKSARSEPSVTGYHSDLVNVDPDHILSTDQRELFRRSLRDHDSVFDPKYKGYNGAVGNFEASINMGPTQPPQRKGRLPQYSHEKLLILQQKCDDLESLGVLRKPEELSLTVEYLNPSFLVAKAKGGHRLVTAFEDVGRYSKPQPSLMPDTDSILRKVGLWKYLIVADLTSAFHQIPLSRQSLKYCGIVTPYKGIRVYTRCAVGMPGSETALEELMSRVLGDHIQAGYLAKLADDLYCGGNSPEELLKNWTKVMESLDTCNLRISPSKTVICPKSTTILGWIWTQGRLSASPHKISVLATCKQPDTVNGLRSFIGAYKVLARVLPSCSHALIPLENAIAGLQSKDKVVWNDALSEHFYFAQRKLQETKDIVLPRRSDKLWIVTDGSVSKCGIGATLYVMRDNKIYLAGFFSAKLRKHQVTWLPCEIEALCIAASVKHFCAYITQSTQKTTVLTDSKPCVQAVEKLRRGEFSASPRVTSFLSTASRYQVNLLHLAGSANVPSDFASRNAADCDNPSCQVCNFIVQMEDSVVRSASQYQSQHEAQTLPFTTRSAWYNIQSECPDLRRVHAHLKQGTRPSRKLTNIRDIKRYLNVAKIAKDGLLVAHRQDPLGPLNELIIVPRNVLDGLLTATHIRMDHPTKHQMLLLVKRKFYALDLSQAIDRVCDSCHTCASLQKVPTSYIEQSSDLPPEVVGINFAADVIKQNRQLIFVLRETVTSFTAACIISDEKSQTLRDALLRLCMELHPLDGPHAVVRVDPAPWFIALREDDLLKYHRINLEIGRVKNPNKNPIAEKAISELEDELVRQEPCGGHFTSLTLATAVARLNSRIRSCGLSARELFTQRNQFTHEQLPLSDRDIISHKADNRDSNHISSALSKSHMKSPLQKALISVGDLVYLYSDKEKTKARPRYIVVNTNDDWCYIKKFIGNQLRSSSYKIKQSECYRVPCESSPKRRLQITSDSDDAEDLYEQNCESAQPHNIPNTDVHQELPIEPDQALAAVPEILAMPLTLPQESSTSVNTPDSDSEVESDHAYTRPQRTKKLPSHLKEYVLY
ncbi:hypothetical protein FSP39_012951 [Pinctada imbricata]|uniref:Integrase catalytic domain-containing protein n=1 Tax=Pinctada imbricata TaxID=66713 RepID=A0AA88XUH9_PINIB|nr:hypothetical protein FSP39_012951 [Pinctada imbricata]